MKDNYQSDLPRYLYEYIEKTTNGLRELLNENNKQQHPKPHTVNLLWNNPIIGADIHFTPWSTGEARSDIGGPESDYFEELVDLAPLPVPSVADIRLLAECLVRSPQALAAVIHLGPKISDVLNWTFSGARTFAVNILTLFCECTRTKGEEQQKAIEALKLLNNNKNNLLLPIIHILLGVIPQYPFAKGAWLFEKEGWVFSDDKIKKWKEFSYENDPATSMFVLLSTVESLQWHAKHDFYVIPNLLEYLIKRTDDISKSYLINQSLPLSQLSLYVTIKPSLTNKQREAFEEMVAKHLSQWVQPLSNLIRAINNATIQGCFDIYDGISDWLSLRWARGLLAIASPAEISFLQDYYSDKNSIHTKIGTKIKMSGEEMLEPASDPNAPSAVALALVSPWGIYRDIHRKTNFDRFPSSNSEVPYYKHTDDSFGIENLDKGLRVGVSCSLDKDNTIFEQAVNNAWFSASDLIQDLLLSSNTLRSLSSQGWYKRAFGTFYYFFDRKRHEERPSNDLKIRGEKEAAYYIKLFKDKIDDIKPNLDILDVGIGYGRLEKSIFEADKKLFRKLRFSGLDVSLEMKKRQEEFFPELELGERYRIGEMLEVQELFPGESFDIIILAFTTFGCYENDAENENVLKNIISMLRPNGVLIIEQFNPGLKKANLSYWDPVVTIEDRHVILEKTTHLLPVSDQCKLYTGQYVYSELTQNGMRLIRRDDYSLKLYTQDWLVSAITAIGITSERCEFKKDFTDDYVNGLDGEIMICEVHLPKNPSSDRAITEEMRNKSKGFIELINSLLLSLQKDRELVEKDKNYSHLFDNDFIQIQRKTLDNINALDVNRDKVATSICTISDDVICDLNKIVKMTIDDYKDDDLPIQFLNKINKIINEIGV